MKVHQLLRSAWSPLRESGTLFIIYGDTGDPRTAVHLLFALLIMLVNIVDLLHFNLLAAHGHFESGLTFITGKGICKLFASCHPGWTGYDSCSCSCYVINNRKML